jgi:DNA-binding LytR/AlgR family response regulator
MDAKDKKIKELKALVKKLKAENEFLKSPLNIFNLIDSIKGTYSILLNPPFKKITTTKGQKACTFEFDINDIVCVISSGKIKWIYFIKPQTSIGGIHYVTDKIHFTGNLIEFCKKFDPPKIHLLQISRSTLINPKYYYLNSNKVCLDGKINPHNKCNNLLISKKCIEDFNLRKSNLEEIASFQKNDIRSK